MSIRDALFPPRVETPEYALVLGRALDKFGQASAVANGLMAYTSEPDSFPEWTEADIEQSYETFLRLEREWRIEQSQLKRCPPKDKRLDGLHNALVGLMQSHMEEITQSFAMMGHYSRKDWRRGVAARENAQRAERRTEVGRSALRLRIAEVDQKDPALIDSLSLPEWVLDVEP